MSLDLAHINIISKALRGLCLGRVYLQEDCSSGDTEIKVGYDATTTTGVSLPGSQLFRNNTLSAVLVQPDANDLPGADGVDYSEALTLEEPTANAMHLEAAQAVDEDYDVAAGAYVRMATLPAVSSGLQMIVKDFTEDMVAPEDKYLPGVFVTWMGTQYGKSHNVAYAEQMTFVVRYAILEEADVDNRATLVTGLEQLVNLLGEDNYLGGTVNESNIASVVPCWDPRSQRRGQVLNTNNRQVLWGDIVIPIVRTVGWDKVSISS